MTKTTGAGGCGCQSQSSTTSTGPSPDEGKSFDLAAIPSPFPTREAASAALRRAFHAEDLRRHERQVRTIAWEREFALRVAEGTGRPVTLDIMPLAGSRTVPESAARWVAAHPRP